MKETCFNSYRFNKRMDEIFLLDTSISRRIANAKFTLNIISIITYCMALSFSNLHVGCSSII